MFSFFNLLVNFIPWCFKKIFISICGCNYACCSVTQSCPTLCHPMDCSTPGLPVHHQLPELSQTHVPQVGDAIQPSYPLSPPSPSAFNLSQHQGLFPWVSSSHQVAKVLEVSSSASVLPVNTQDLFLLGFDLLAVQGTLRK